MPAVSSSDTGAGTTGTPVTEPMVNRTYLDDTFTRTTANIAGSTSDSGGVWTGTHGAADYGADGSKMYFLGTDNTSYTTIPSGAPGADYTAYFKDVIVNTLSGNGVQSIYFIGKFSDSSNFVLMLMTIDNAGATALGLYKKIAGSLVLIGSISTPITGNTASSGPFDVSIKTLGLQIVATINGKSCVGYLAAGDDTALASSNRMGTLSAQNISSYSISEVYAFTTVFPYDSGAGTDTATSIDIPSSDAGTGTDVNSALTVALSSADSFAGTDAATSITIPSNDTGTGTDVNSALTVTGSSSDSFTGTDEGSLATDSSSSDAGTGTDASSSPPATLSPEDSFAGTDIATLIAQPSSDAGSFVDIDSAKTMSITGDSMVGTDSADIVSPQSSDAAFGTDTHSSLAADSSDVDVFVYVEVESYIADIEDSDTVYAFEAQGPQDDDFGFFDDEDSDRDSGDVDFLYSDDEVDSWEVDTGVIEDSASFDEAGEAALVVEDSDDFAGLDAEAYQADVVFDESGTFAELGRVSKVDSFEFESATLTESGEGEVRFRLGVQVQAPLDHGTFSDSASVGILAGDSGTVSQSGSVTTNLNFVTASDNGLGSEHSAITAPIASSDSGHLSSASVLTAAVSASATSSFTELITGLLKGTIADKLSEDIGTLYDLAGLELARPILDVVTSVQAVGIETRLLTRDFDIVTSVVPIEVSTKRRIIDVVTSVSSESVISYAGPGR